MIYSSSNIQYQRTGVGSMDFLGKLELRQSIWDVCWREINIIIIIQQQQYKDLQLISVVLQI